MSVPVRLANMAPPKNDRRSLGAHLDDVIHSEVRERGVPLPFDCTNTPVDSKLSPA